MRHPRDLRDDERFIAPHQFQIIRGARGTADQFVKREHRRFAAGHGNHNLPAPDGVRRPVWRVAVHVTQEPKPFVRMSDGSLVERMVVNPGRWPWDLSVVDGRVQVQDAETALQKVDAWDERGALDAVFVEIVRMTVRRRDQNDSV